MQISCILSFSGSQAYKNELRQDFYLNNHSGYSAYYIFEKVERKNANIIGISTCVTQKALHVKLMNNVVYAKTNFLENTVNLKAALFLGIMFYFTLKHKMRFLYSKALY